MARTIQKAFTLVELLVVIAIIVVLLALLVPAMDKAIYQAELTVCGTRHHALGGAVTTYAMEFNRRYPYRAGVSGAAAWPNGVAHGTTNEGAATGGPSPLDDRPRLRPYFALNASLNCPLTQEVDIEGSKPDTIVRTAFDLWFGWRYSNYRGMEKVGDRWGWDDNGALLASSLLTTTPFVVKDNGSTATSSHPDREGTYFQNILQDGYSSPAAAEYNLANYRTANMTLTQWVSNNTKRGPSDLNAGYADLSVARVSDAKWQGDGRFARVPVFSNGKNWATDHQLVPER